MVELVPLADRLWGHSLTFAATSLRALLSNAGSLAFLLANRCLILADMLVGGESAVLGEWDGA